MISENCHEFATHLFEHASDEELRIPHEYTDAPAGALEALGLNRVEWHLAYSAAIEARKTGKTPASYLEKAGEFLTGRFDNVTGEKIFNLEAWVSGAGPR